jgi:DNA-directed RNA polymerase specialized sigma24 family protein
VHSVPGPDGSRATAWLRRILATTLVDLHRRYGRDKRDAGLERSLEQALEPSSLCLGKLWADEHPMPRAVYDQADRQVSLAEVLTRLPESQRMALTLRYLHDPPCSLAEIARQLERTEKAAAGLVSPALETLR